MHASNISLEQVNKFKVEVLAIVETLKFVVIFNQCEVFGLESQYNS
jgi:hypothetical protein